MTRRSVSVILSACLIGFLILYVSGLLRWIEGGLHRVMLPVARVASRIGFQIDQHVTPFVTRTDLEHRIGELESQRDSISVDYVQLRALEEENRSLKKIAKFLNETGYDHVGAQVIARSTDPHQATMLIDRGTADGLENGMAVVAEEGVFVGKISAIREHVATVTLLSDVRSRVAASTAGEERLMGMIQGEGNGVARVTLVPQSETLEKDQLIVTAGTEEKIPSNLIVGLITQVEGKPTDPFKTATLEFFAQLHRLDVVIVLRPTALRPS